MTMISDLPMELKNEILSRVPLKSMRAVRLTCTKWNNLSKSRIFSEMHIGKAASTTREGESTMIVSMDYNLHLVNVVVNGDPSTELKGKLVCLNEQVKISHFFHCDGLLLCILKDNTTKVVVWNPYSGQTRWIEPRYSHQRLYGFKDRFRYAIGYANKKNTSCRSYKILRFLDDTVSPPGNYDAGARFIWYEMYDFDSDSWTTLDVPSDWCITFNQRGVSLKGNTYFCATKSDTEEELDNHIICFDFTSERFGPLLPLPFDAGNDDYVNLSCFKEEKLAVLLTHNEVNPYEMDIWITTKIEVQEVTWSKFLTLDMEPHYCPISSGTFFIDEEKKVAMGFDEDDGYNHHKLCIVGEGGYLRNLVLGERADKNSTHSTNMSSYVPSLAQIKQVAAGKRKQQSDLEKHRFDEKLARLVALENGVEE